MQATLSEQLALVTGHLKAGRLPFNVADMVAEITANMASDENGKHRHTRRRAAGRYFLRYVASREQIQRDLREKRSYVGYISFATMAEVQAWANSIGLPSFAALAAECSDRRFRFALPGLCGFAYDAVEDARADALQNKSFDAVSRWPLAAIFTGYKVAETDDADLFIPYRFVGVVEIDRAADAITGETHLPAVGRMLSNPSLVGALVSLLTDAHTHMRGAA